MKKHLLLLLLVIMPGMIFSQGAYITDGLWNALKSRKADTGHVRIVLVMRDKLDIPSLATVLEKNNVPLEHRQRTLIRSLHHTASESQKGVLHVLQEKKWQGSVNDIQTYWIANIITAGLSAELVWKLAERADIETIELESDRTIAPIKPVSQEPCGKLQPGEAEPGLKVIGADALWRMGYTGRNRIAYNIDTGVWPDHPALKDRFLGNFFPMSQSWLPFDREFPGDKTGSHGTHTLGTIAGLDPATADTIGCAFNAYWICSDPIVTNLALVRPLAEILLAFQWALNPDGDTSTVWDIPDVINNSWGMEPASDSSLCDSYASQAFLAVEAAGIAIVFSAGNEGPGAGTISSPHHIASNIVNLFTVGALDGNQSSYPIASFSSRGPGICGGSGSILIKPEVSAPGVSVRSAVNQTGYAYYSGTSMAGPHASGAVLLLKEAFPYLPGSEILKALYFTATDLGDPGEDNTYGMGLIHVEHAFQYLSSLYTPVAPDSNTYDAEIASISFPDGLFHCDSLINPVVVLRNNGDSTIFSGGFRYHIVGDSVHDFHWAGNLTPGNSLQVALPPLTAGSGGRKEFSVCFSGDTNFTETSLINNCRIARFDFRPPVALPFIEDFESGWNRERWSIINPDQNMTWDTMAAGGLLHSSYSAVMQFSTKIPTGQIDEFVSPAFNLQGLDSVALCFDVAYQHRHPSLADSLRIFISTDCGLTFPHRIYTKGGPALQTYDTATQNFVPWRADQWRTEYVDLSAFTGHAAVLIKFSAFNRKGNNLFVDNIKVYSGAEPAGILSRSDATVRIYPNPASDILHIETGGHAGSEMLITITDISGKVHFHRTLNSDISGKVNLNIRELSAGMYFVNISSNQGAFSGRFIKISK